MVNMRQIGIRAVLISIFFPMFIVTSTYGQQWRVFTVADGLADNNVYCMLESRNKNLWFGTSSGLSQFNGLFTTHLSGLGITKLLESQDGKIWVGTNNGLYSYDGKNWTRHLNRIIYCLLRSRDKGIWAGTDSGLYQYNGIRWQEYLDGEKIFCLLESKAGMILAGTGAKGLYNYDGIKWSEYLSKVKGIYSLLESRDSEIWIGTVDDGLYSYNGGKWKHHQIEAKAIYSLLESKDGKIWVGTMHEGLYSYDKKEWQQYLTKTAVYSLLELQDGTVWSGTDKGLYSIYNGSLRRVNVSGNFFCLLESKDGAIWAGTSVNGLYSCNVAKWKEHPIGDYVHSLLELQNGRIWACTISKLYSYDGTQWQELPIEPRMGQIRSLLELEDGRIWAGTVNGLYSYNEIGWQQEHLNGIGIEALMESKDGTIWVGTWNNGLYSFNGKAWIKYLDEVKAIISLLESKDGRIWVGTMNDGLYSYNGSTWTKHLAGMSVHSLLESQDKRIWSGVSGSLYSYDGVKWHQHPMSMMGIITSLLESRDGKIWIGTEYGGVQIYDGTIWEEFTISDGLPSNNVISILEDRNGKLWFGTEDGISIYKPNLNPPKIKITKIDGKNVAEVLVNGSYTTGKPTVYIEWMGADMEDLQDLTYQHKIDESAWSERISANFMITPPIDNGRHIFCVRAIDKELNHSESAILIIEVDTIKPIVFISSPVDGSVVGDTVKIIGSISDPELKGFLVEYANGSSPKDDDFIMILEKPENISLCGIRENILVCRGIGYEKELSGLLTEWNTSKLNEGIYTIRLAAINESGYVNSFRITVTLDKTPPIARIISPKEGTHLTKRISIIGEISDLNLNSYVLEYSSDLDPDIAFWRQIQKVDALLYARQTISIYQNWDFSSIAGKIFIRLVAIDTAGNISMDIVSIEIPKAVESNKSEKINSSDGNAYLYIPPRSFKEDVILAINRVPIDEIQPSLDNFSFPYLAYDIEPTDIKFDPIKPATLQISLDEELTQKRVALFRWNISEWLFLGGTIQEGRINTVITQGGRYALMEVKSGFADLLETEFLFTCQPRVFLPEQGGTTISFSLQKEALVTLKVYSTNGRLQRTLFSGDRILYAGRNAILWDGRNEEDAIVSSGIYIIALQIGSQSVKTKTVVIQNR